MSELSTDALHLTSPLRTGRRVGRTIYAQLGPEPSDDDPLIGVMDTPELAARVVEAVNAAVPVAREDTASPDEAQPATDPGYDRVGTIRIAPGYDPASATALRVIAVAGSSPHHIRLTGPDTAVVENGGDRWSDEEVSSWRIQPWALFAVAVRLAAPAQPAVAPDTPNAVRQFREAIEHARWMPLVASHIQDRLDVVQAEVDRLRPASVAPDAQSGAPTRSVYVRLADGGVDSTTEPVDDVRIDWTCTPGSGWAPIGVEVLGASGVEVDGEDVLRGGGADGGGEDEEALRSLAAAVAASDEAPDMGLAWLTDYTHAETEDAWTAGTCVLGKCVDRRYPDAVCEHEIDDYRREVVRLRRVVQRIAATNIPHLSRQYRAICKRYGRASAEIARLRGENARLRTEEREEVTKLRTKLTAARPHYGHIARLASAAGVSPDSDDVVGAVEAAIRAGRARGEVITSVEAVEVLDWLKAINAQTRGGNHLVPVIRRMIKHLTDRPPAPLTVGEEVSGDRAVSAPVDTTLRCTTAAVVALRGINGWSLTGWTAEADPEHHVRVNTWRVVEVGAP